MNLQLVNDATRWNTALAALPYRHVLQTWENAHPSILDDLPDLKFDLATDVTQ